MENEILDILKDMQVGQKEILKRLDNLEAGQSRLEASQKVLEENQKILEVNQKALAEGQKKLEVKLDAVVEQTADLIEFRNDITTKVDKVISDIEELRKDLTNVEVITASNWADIAKLKAVK